MGDVVSFELPMPFRLTRYAGVDQDKRGDRYALERGPILLALEGASELPLAPNALVGRLAPVREAPLHFSVKGVPGCTFLPYWEIQDQPFTCFPVYTGEGRGT